MDGPRGFSASGGRGPAAGPVGRGSPSLLRRWPREVLCWQEVEGLTRSAIHSGRVEEGGRDRASAKATVGPGRTGSRPAREIKRGPFHDLIVERAAGSHGPSSPYEALERGVRRRADRRPPMADSSAGSGADRGARPVDGHGGPAAPGGILFQGWTGRHAPGGHRAEGGPPPAARRPEGIARVPGGST